MGGGREGMGEEGRGMEREEEEREGEGKGRREGERRGDKLEVSKKLKFTKRTTTTTDQIKNTHKQMLNNPPPQLNDAGLELLALLAQLLNESRSLNQNLPIGRAVQRAHSGHLAPQPFEQPADVGPAHALALWRRRERGGEMWNGFFQRFTHR